MEVSSDDIHFQGCANTAGSQLFSAGSRLVGLQRFSCPGGVEAQLEGPRVLFRVVALSLEGQSPLPFSNFHTEGA